MSHYAIDGQEQIVVDPGSNPGLAKLDRILQQINRAVMVPCMLALLAASLILTYSVVARYFLKISTEWQDEAAVFLLVGATFFAGAFVQSHRGHVGIEALAGMLPAAVNRARMLMVDLMTALFCAFFSWKSWTLFHEAWAEGHTTTSTWGPPLWIPYSAMAAGMTLLTVQVLLQFVIELQKRRKVIPEEHAEWLGD